MYLVYKSILLIFLSYCTYTDIKKREIEMFPVYMCIIIPILGILFWNQELIYTLLGVFPGVILLIISFFTKGAIGEGDGYIFFPVGMMMGVGIAINLMMIAFLIAALFSIVCMVCRKKKKEDKIPFAPFILAGYLGVILLG